MSARRLTGVPPPRVRKIFGLKFFALPEWFDGWVFGLGCCFVVLLIREVLR